MSTHDKDRQRLLKHVQRTGLLRPAKPAPATTATSTTTDPLAPPTEEPGLRLDADQVLTATGHQVSVRARRLSDLLGIGGEQPAPLADRQAARALLHEGQDPVLYRALRDIFPARTDTRAPVRADLVVFEPGTLPGGEPYRSLGHWNPPTQVEAFEVLSGRIVMLIAGISPDGTPFSHAQTLSPGDQIAVPLGIWHVSYVLEGPAVVFNMFVDPYTPLDLGVHGGHDGKYQSKAPVAVTLRRSPDGHLSAVGSEEDLATWGDPLRPPPVNELTAAGRALPWLAPEESLTSLFLRASADHWNALVDQAVSEHAPPRKAVGIPGAW